MYNYTKYKFLQLYFVDLKSNYLKSVFPQKMSNATYFLDMQTKIFDST